ncbi:MAG TPA: ATP-binding protein [Bacteroidota bacterium]|nr:ATP-binding protein [Bacteroidota bacterium]
MTRSFKRSIQSLPSVFEFLGEFIDKERLSEGDAFTLRFASEELFTNLVKYNPESPSDIALSVTRDGSSAILRIVDQQAQAFDPTKRPELDLNKKLEERRPGGLGIHLVKRMIDKIEYQHVDNKSIYTLTQHLE